MSAIVVLCTFPNSEAACNVAQKLIAERLVACVNILPAVTSIYRWQGNIEESPEVLCLCKTTQGAYPALEARVLQLHPYTVPEILALPATAVSPDYLQWLSESVDSSAP